MNPPIYNPIVPFNMGISVRQGFMVFVRGVANGGRFSVNFKTGPGAESDYALHFNPRFDEGNVVVRNTRRGGRWEAEERHSNGFPFVRGQPFELIFLFQEHQFKVAVNGRHFIEYAHRMPYHKIQYLTVEGGVKLNQISFDQEAAPPPQPTPNVITNPMIPHNALVPFNNIKNRRVVISGMPENRHPQKFTVDFQTAGPSSNIFLHFNPRFNEQSIVRNTLMNGSWGREERQLGVPFPFHYGVPYQLTFVVDQYAFRVELNGSVICTYNHRQRPLNLIRHVVVSGSTSVSRISFE